MRLLLLVAALLWAGPVFAQGTASSLGVRDANGTAQTTRTYRNSDGSQVFGSQPEMGGAPIARTNPMPTTQAPFGYNALGFCQLSVTTSSAVALSSCSGGVPSGSLLAQITVETNTIRMRDDTTAPTATVGFPILPGMVLPYSGPLASVQFIAIAGSATVDVNFYK